MMETVDRAAFQQASFFRNGDFTWYIASLPSIVAPADQTPSHSLEQEDSESASHFEADSEVHSTASLLDSEIDVI